MASEHFFDSCLDGVLFCAATYAGFCLVLRTLTKRQLRATVCVELRPHKDQVNRKGKLVLLVFKKRNSLYLLWIVFRLKCRLPKLEDFWGESDDFLLLDFNATEGNARHWLFDEFLAPGLFVIEVWQRGGCFKGNEIELAFRYDCLYSSW